jgi:ribonucleoside-triphosphate reductase
VYSRVVGYLRPVKQWNEGKQAEYRRRKTFKVDLSTETKDKPMVKSAVDGPQRSCEKPSQEKTPVHRPPPVSTVA